MGEANLEVVDDSKHGSGAHVADHGDLCTGERFDQHGEEERMRRFVGAVQQLGEHVQAAQSFEELANAASRGPRPVKWSVGGWVSGQGSVINAPLKFVRVRESFSYVPHHRLVHTERVRGPRVRSTDGRALAGSLDGLLLVPVHQNSELSLPRPVATRREKFTDDIAQGDDRNMCRSSVVTPCVRSRA